MIDLEELKNIVSNYFIVTIDTIKFNLLTSLFIINKILFEDIKKIDELETKIQNIQLDENDTRTIEDIINKLTKYSSEKFGSKIHIAFAFLNDEEQMEKYRLINNFIYFVKLNINDIDDNDDVKISYDKMKINDIIYFHDYFNNTYSHTYILTIYDIDIFKKIITKFLKLNKLLTS